MHKHLILIFTLCALDCVAAEPQPGITAIVATVAELGEGWTSNRVMVLMDPLWSPK